MENTDESPIEAQLEQALQLLALPDQGSGKVCAKFQLPEDFSGFRGHFPGAPVFPAIFQMVIVRLLAEMASGRKLRPRKTGRVKFSGMIKPMQQIFVEVICEEKSAAITASFSFSMEGKKVCSGSASFVSV